jgi:hypothetical protein
VTQPGRAAAVVLLVALSGVVVRAQAPPAGLVPDVEYDKTWDFGRYRTFAWAPFLEPAANATTHRLLAGAIERGLIAQGLKLVPGPRADAYVNYWVKAETKVEGAPSVDRTPRWGANDPRVVIELKEARAGTLVIELWDGAGGNLVWRSKVSGALGTTREVQQQIDHVVERMLDDYPKPKD